MHGDVIGCFVHFFNTLLAEENDKEEEMGSRGLQHFEIPNKIDC